MRLARVLLAALFTVVLAAGATAEEPKPLRALLVTGGCCHDYESQKKILTEGISARANVAWTVVHQGGDDRNVAIPLYENSDWAKGFDVVVHNECFGGVTDVPFVERIAAAHDGGVPAVMLHCAAHSYRNAKTDEWRKALGVTSSSHESRRPLKVENLKPDHPLMRGFPEVWNTPSDELYKVTKLWPTATPLARAYGVGGKREHVVIWTNTHGGTPVFATTLGHGNETMRHEVYLDLVARGLLWATGKLDADGQPKPGYGPK